MTYQTLLLSSIESYLKYVGKYEGDADVMLERGVRLQQFPYAVMLEMSYPELDYAIRWCWLRFGLMDGECTQKQSEYQVCFDELEHLHNGRWTSYWFGKTDYDFGYNEFYFSAREDCDYFIAHLSEINWGEHYPK